VLPDYALAGIYTQAEIYDYFAAAVIKEESQGKTVVAVEPGWRSALEDGLAGRGIQPEEVLSDKSLVSMVGSPAFIARSYSRASSLLGGLGITVHFQEQDGIRCTFAIPADQSARSVQALYEAFAA
jgi:hypothetical protein